MKTGLYSCRTVYRHSFKENGLAKRAFEERIVLIQARDFQAALIQAEKEARQYSRQLKGCTYLGHVAACIIDDIPLKHGSEIYSLIRDSDLADKTYLRRFIETGTERQENITLRKKRE